MRDPVARRLRIVVLAALLGATGAPGRAQGQWQPGELYRLSDFENACSQSQSIAGADERCRQAVSAALGKAAIVQEERLPDGGVRRTGKLLEADVPKAGWLMEEACAHGHWETCMLYVMLLERGDQVPADPVRAEALLQVACAGHHFRACEGLREKRVEPSPNPGLPPRPTWVRQPTPPPREPLPPLPSGFGRTPEPVMPSPPTTTPAPPDRPMDPDDPTETELVEACRRGGVGSCYSLAMGYERGQGVPQDAQRSRYYYEKACDGGVQRACDRIGKAMPDAARRANAGRRTRALLLFGGMLVAVVGGLSAGAIWLLRKLRG